MKPVEVSDVLLAFPGDVKHLIPPQKEIPERFWTQVNDWTYRLFNDMFFHGLRPGVKFYARPDIDARMAVRHIQAVMRSFEPKHEHKEAACRYLMDLWFSKVEWEPIEVQP